MGFFAQKGSASRCSLPGVGAFPVYSTSPSMVSAIAAAGRISAAATAMSLEQVISNPLVLEGRATSNASPTVKAWTGRTGHFFRSSLACLA